MERGAWKAAVHGVAEGWTRLSNFTFTFHLHHWRRQWHPTPALLSGKSHGWRSLVGCSPWGREESDTTERLHFHFSLSCIGEGNGNPLQCSCLENARDRGACWTAVYGVAQSQTRLKRLSSSKCIFTFTVSVLLFIFIYFLYFFSVVFIICYCCYNSLTCLEFL